MVRKTIQNKYIMKNGFLKKIQKCKSLPSEVKTERKRERKRKREKKEKERKIEKEREQEREKERPQFLVKYKCCCQGNF